MEAEYHKDALEVFVRIKEKDSEYNNIKLLESKDEILINREGKPLSFKFPKSSIITDLNSKETIFNLIMNESLQKNVIECIFSYGITSSGKTHTIIGNLNNPNEYGLLPKTIKYLQAHGNMVRVLQPESLAEEIRAGHLAAAK